MFQIQKYRILNKLISLSGHSTATLCYLYNGRDNCTICRSDSEKVQYSFLQYESQFEAYMDDLFSDGFLVHTFNNANFHLTSRGLHYKKYLIQLFIKYFICSVLVPIFIGVASSYINSLH